MIGFRPPRTIRVIGYVVTAKSGNKTHSTYETIKFPLEVDYDAILGDGESMTFVWR